MSGQDIAAEVSAAIRQVARQVGRDAGAGAAIIRTAGADETVYPPTPGADSEFPCDVIVSQYSSADKDGTNIQMGDVKLLMASDAATDPRGGDRVRVSGNVFDVVSVAPYMPGGVVLYWTVQARRA